MANVGARGGLVVSLGLNDRQFRRGISRANQQLGIFGRQLSTDSTIRVRRFGRELSTLGGSLTRNLTLPLGLAGAAAVRFATQWETSITRVSTLTGVPIAEVRRLGESVRDLSSDVGIASAQLNESLLVSVSAGNRGAAAVDIVNASAMAAQIGLGDLNTITRAVTVTVQNFGEAGVNAARATDVLLATVQQGNFDSTQLATVWGQLAPLASGLGLSVERLGANYAQLSLSTGSAALSSTQLQAVLRAFVRPSAEAERALEQVGLTVDQVRLLVGSQGLAPTLVQLETQLAAVGLGLQDVFSDSQALIGAQTLARDAEDVAAVLENVEAGAGGVNRQFQEIAMTAEFQLNQALTSFQELGVSVGETILPTVASAAGNVSGVLSGLTGEFEDLNSATQSAILGFGALVALAGPASSAFGRVFLGSAGLVNRLRGASSAFTEGRATRARTAADLAAAQARTRDAQAAFDLAERSAPPPPSGASVRRVEAARTHPAFSAPGQTSQIGRYVEAQRRLEGQQRLLTEATNDEAVAKRASRVATRGLISSLAQLGVPIAAVGAAVVLYSATLDDQRVAVADNTSLLESLAEALEGLVPATRSAVDAQRDYLAALADDRDVLRDGDNDPFSALARARAERDTTARNRASIESGAGFARFLGGDTLAEQSALITNAAADLLAIQVSSATAGDTLNVANAIADLSRDANEFAAPTQLPLTGLFGLPAIVDSVVDGLQLGTDVTQGLTRADVERIVSQSPALRSVYEEFRSAVGAGDDEADLAALSDFTDFLTTVQAFAVTEQSRQTEIRGLVEAVSPDLIAALEGRGTTEDERRALVLQREIAAARDLTGNWEDVSDLLLAYANLINFTTNETDALAAANARNADAIREDVAAYNAANNALTRLVTTQTSLRETLGLNNPVLQREEGLQALVESQAEGGLLAAWNRLTVDPDSPLLDEYNQATIDAIQSWFASIQTYVGILGNNGEVASVESVIMQQRDALRALQSSLPERTYQELLQRLSDIRTAALDPDGSVTSTTIAQTTVGAAYLQDIETLRQYLEDEPLELVTRLREVVLPDGTTAPLDEAGQLFVDDLARAFELFGIIIPADIESTPANERLDALFERITGFKPDPITVDVETERAVTDINAVNALLREAIALGIGLDGVGGLPPQGGQTPTTRTPTTPSGVRPGATGAERARILRELSPSEREQVNRLNREKDIRDAEADRLTAQRLSGTETLAEQQARTAREMRIRELNEDRFNFLQARGLATGGIVTEPTFALLGEGGEDELVLPLSRARERGFGGQTINVIVNGDVYDTAQNFADKVEDALRDNVRLKGSGYLSRT